MKVHNLNTKDITYWKETVSAGDKIFLSGVVYTARDAAHKRISESLNTGSELPFQLKDAVIYYAGPTPTPHGLPIGSCGPTTSSRMDSYAPTLYDSGVICTIGKGPRDDKTTAAISKNNALYLCAIGGAAALAAQSIIKCEVIAFDDLGCESIKKLEFKDFPLFVAIDSRGVSIFNL